MKRNALLSADGRYRWWLSRQWGSGPGLCWIMHNPSTADADVDDPTIRRCIRFSQRDDYGWLIVVNLYAYRATDPKALRSLDTATAIGIENYGHVLAALEGTEAAVAAWGAVAPPSGQAWVGYPLLCLGKTKAGHPRHPLYVRGDQPFEMWDRLQRAVTP